MNLTRFLVVDVSRVLLYGNVLIFATFLVFYGTREPWWRSWFGWTIVLLLAAILQLSVRGLITDLFGEDYPGRDMVLMLGRLELAVSGLALFVALLRKRHPRL
ncbi:MULTISPECIES: putative phage holin [unclassified Nocardioides]|uniref:putative phage holin n=1 Tax=unclassified Nocardioides TaxID=2615069 RepID=UPI0009F135C9|nr:MULTISPECIES: hypothetical protein [unclassified Nocardioides]GAW50626.1 hypothetical protein PD653B2_2962 [Nocardioides sp. PD653-B2]GAW55525.1 hypothetical protein PD653_2950 [Nocardioides sp. PD653]